MKNIEDYKKKSKKSFNNQASTYDADNNGEHARSLYSELILSLS